MSLPTGFHLLIGGKWVALVDPDPDVPVSVSRDGASFTSIDGTVYLKRAERSNRSWVLAYENDVPTVVQWLGLAAQGLAGDVWLYDVAAAQVNMLDPRDTVGRDSAQPTVAVDGVALRSFAGSYSLTRRLRNGQAYTLTGWTTHTAAATIATYDIGAGPVNIAAPAGTGPRKWTVPFTPAADVTATIIVTVAGKTTALRLTEGALDTLGFAPGQNTPCQVAVSDPQRTLVAAFSDKPSTSDHNITLREVG